VRQYLIAGLVDEMLISLVPTLFGGGERLFEGVGDDLHGLKCIGTLTSPQVTHLRFARP
jgi:dihydrofolate reductase